MRLDELGDCTLCVASPFGRGSARRIMTTLEAADPRVAKRPHGGERHDYAEWGAMPGQIREWYLEATGRAPSPSELGHHMYAWREEHVAAAEIRRRIFAAAGKSQ